MKMAENTFIHNYSCIKTPQTIDEPRENAVAWIACKRLQFSLKYQAGFYYLPVHLHEGNFPNSFRDTDRVDPEFVTHYVNHAISKRFVVFRNLWALGPNNDRSTITISFKEFQLPVLAIIQNMCQIGSLPHHWIKKKRWAIIGDLNFVVLQTH